MTEEQLKKLAQKVKAIGLSPEKKSLQESNIRAFMRANPIVSVTNAEVVSQMKSNGNVPVRSYFLNPFWARNPMPIALMLILLLGGGTTAAASGALPGDTLYSVKINVNENVERILATNAEARAGVEARLASRRIEEAEKLAREDRLDDEKRAEIATHFAARAEKVHEAVLRLQAEGDASAAASVSSDFEASLDAHRGLLVALSAREAANSNESAPAIAAVSLRATEDGTNAKSASFAGKAKGVDLVGILDVELSRVREGRASFEADLKKDEQNADSSVRAEVKLGAVGALRAAENKINEAERFISAKAEVRSEVKAEAEAKLALAKADLEAGKKKLEAQSYAEAFALAKKAQRRAQEAQLEVAAEGRVQSELLMPGVRAEVTGGLRVRPDSEVKEPPASEETQAIEQKEIQDGRTEVKTETGVRVNIGL
ncbi:MAG: DUF5667 domain-containing protein [Patescibacteria group bacterium]